MEIQYWDFLKNIPDFRYWRFEMLTLKKFLISTAFCLVAGSVSAAQVGYWSFDDVAGSLTTTDSVNGIDAVARSRGAATTDTSKVTFGSDGVFGSTSVTLNGGYLELTSESVSISDALECLYSGDNTINLWIRPDAFNDSGWTSIFGDWTKQWSFQYYLNAYGTIHSYLSASVDGNASNDANRRITVYSSQNVPLDEWSMLTFTRDYETGAAQIWLNGELVGTASSDEMATIAFAPFKAYTALQFGVKGDEIHRTFQGSVDEASIYDTVLQPYQIRNLYATNSIGEIPDIYLNRLFGNTFVEALQNKANDGASAQNGGTAIVKAEKLVAGSDGSYVVNLKSDSTDGIFLDLTGQNQLHGNVTGSWGSILSNQCGNDSAAYVASDDVEHFGGIGMHANSMLTFDLNEIRTGLGSEDATLGFSTTVTLPDCGSRDLGKLYSLAIQSSDEEGVLGAWLFGEEIGFHQSDDGYWILELPEPMPSQATRAEPVDVSFDILPEADYLSLFMLTGLDSTCDHGYFLNAKIGAVPEPSAFALLFLGLATLVAGGRLVRRKNG